MRKKTKQNNSASLQQLNFFLYVLLLIMTPFLLLQNYLQAAIGVASNSSFELGGMSVPWVIVVALVIMAALLIWVRKVIRWRYLVVVLIMAFLYWLGQQVTDFYLNHKFYELQHNWHYLAYWGFSIVSWRFWKAKGRDSAQIILYTLLFAFSASFLDEIAQVPLSNRVFDVCDIAKDIYGAVIGNIFVFYVLEDGRDMKGVLKLAHPRLKDYFKDAKTLLVFEYIFVFIFLVFTSALSDITYFPLSMLLPAGVFLVIWFVIHLMGFRISRLIITGLLALCVVALSGSYLMNRKKNITHNSYGLTVYKGIPIPYLDIMIFENGSWRLVDKKHVFNLRDQRTLLSHSSDILLIGSGAEGKGGKGFIEPEPVQFIYNTNTRSMTQVIILPTPEACKVYNRLKEEKKNVTFVLHNTC